MRLAKKHGVCANSFAALIAMNFMANLSLAGEAQNAQASAGFCIDCIRIRVGLPRIVRGPAPNIADSIFSVIKLPNGRFRGFTANSTSYAIDGKAPWDMGGPAITVLKPGPPGSMSSCGQWLGRVERAGKLLNGWIHNETACNYQTGQTHASMSFATSADDGLTWNVKGFIITGKPNDKPSPGVMTGESCFSITNGGDGYYYAYCTRFRDHTPYIARASIADPGPGNWKRYFNGDWSQPGLGGDGSPAMGSGVNTSYWTAAGQMVSVTWVPGGLGIATSQDRINFKNFPQPLLKLDTGRWDRKGPPNELLSYATLIDAETGLNQLSDHWLLVYMYLQPNEGFDKRYLVFRAVEVSRSSRSDEPPVAVALARWYNAKLHDRWSTVAPVPGNYSAYKLEKQTGYLLTAADLAKPAVELEDCVSQWPGHPDHILEAKGVCERDPIAHYMRLRSAGFAYSRQQAHTLPLYRCYSAQDRSHFASNAADCEKLGTMEKLLGYVLSE
jgi:hypothetical protein